MLPSAYSAAVRLQCCRPPTVLLRLQCCRPPTGEVECERAPSLVGLARTYVYQPHSDETLYAIQQGLEAMPSRNDLLLDLVIVSAHRGNLPGAPAPVQHLQQMAFR